MPIWALVLMVIVNSLGVLMLFTTHRRVWGLKGGYNKGVWAGSILRNALRDRRDAWVIYAIIVLLNVLITLAFLEPVPTL